MNLRAKKQLAAKTFGIGKERVLFIEERLDEIKEAITKQDMRDLYRDGAIKIKEIKGRKKIKTKKRKRSAGNIRKNVNVRKRNYVILTRKLRKYAKDLKNRGELDKNKIKEIRKKIRNKTFRSKAHMKEQIGENKHESPKTKKKRK
ncbi:MAG: 50S ribosomal protein L19e [Candidatus Diapherotrites archaeon]